MITYQTPVLEAWVDYNGHLRDAFYLLIFSYATDAFMDHIGLAGAERASSGTSLFTLEAHINYLQEVKLGAVVKVHTYVIGHDTKRVHLYHTLQGEQGNAVLAASEQMLLHVDLAGPRAAVFADQSAALLVKFASAQGELPEKPYLGNVIALPHRRPSTP